MLAIDSACVNAFVLFVMDMPYQYGSAACHVVHMCRRGIIGMGVADGVYQWREKGIDAGDFSRLLMHTSLQAVEEGQSDVFKGLLSFTQTHTLLDPSMSDGLLTCACLLQMSIQRTTATHQSFPQLLVLVNMHIAAMLFVDAACLQRLVYGYVKFLSPGDTLFGHHVSRPTADPSLA